MTALPNIGGALCKSSVIPFLVSLRKLWLTPVLEYRAVTLHVKVMTHMLRWLVGVKRPFSAQIRLYHMLRTTALINTYQYSGTCEDQRYGNTNGGYIHLTFNLFTTA